MDYSQVVLPYTISLITYVNRFLYIFRREHFFRGRDNEDQLLKIVKVLGTDDFERYLTQYRLFFQTYNDDLLQRYVFCMSPADAEPKLTLIAITCKCW